MWRKMFNSYYIKGDPTMADLLRETYSSASMCPPQLLQVPVKGDVIVPDTKPDADKILQTSVRYMLWSIARSEYRANWNLRFYI